ncbi:hypothetical protein TRFO_34255 [Tritrichomonas foetus]|uniref:Uncharacterized protein n=1 Tax=Tritrichomonas foetus TaxID=1144522 RepID=A0A1J4JJH9_9EUKA|nr:hypothetical protein TRFO_34255 [Tritrichomonas foetus]|eukprot:OHS99318.1 hypothetical protein TRFO_34255 [Tritrichomonas foetus]
MKIDRGKNRRFDRLIDFERPNSLGLKWRFFIFAINLKRCSISNYTFSLIAFIIEILMTIAPSFYPMLYTASISDNPPSQISAVFPYSGIMCFISPTVFSTASWVTLFLIICIVTVVSFVICLWEPSYSLYLHLILNSRIHNFLLPWISGTFGYAIYCVSNYDVAGVFNELPFHMALPIAFIIVFIFYLYTITLLNFADANSMVNPNPISAQWFTFFPYWYTLEIAFISVVGYQCINFSKSISYVFIVIGVIISIATVVHSILTMPMVLFVANEIMAVKMVSIASFLLLSLFSIEFEFEYSNVILTLVPVYITFVFMFVHFLFERKRSSIQQLLSQVDTDVEQLSMESLQTTLSPLTSQVSLITLVKEGLLSGNKAVVSDVFVQYCLELFPRSEWFLGYVGFLYGIVWNTHPNVYRFLLHLLSLDAFSSAAEYVLFQYIYCYMQVSQSQSPMILRKLSQFRQTAVNFVSAHRKFWMAAIDNNEMAFNESSVQMFRIFLQMRHQKKVLKLMFPFCPAVRSEICIFQADFMHNIVKADSEYCIAASLLNPESEFINTALFDGYSMFFPSARKMNVKVEDPEDAEYQFLSFQEHYDDSHRQGLSLNINDTYLTSLTHTFTMDKNQPQISPKVGSIGLFFLYLLTISSVIIYIAALIAHHYINPKLYDSFSEFRELNLVLNATTYFRANVNSIQFDIILLTNIANKTFPGFDVDYNFFYFILEHLSVVESDILEYKYLLDNLEPLKSNPSLIQICDGVNCTFSYLFGVLHEKCLFFLHSSTANETVNEDPSAGLDEIVNDLTKIIENIYTLIFKEYTSNIENLINSMTKYMSILIGIELFMAVFVSIASTYLQRRMRKNVTDVIRTAQPPIIQYIATQFDKLLSFDQYQQPELSRYSMYGSYIPLIIMFVLLSIYPAYILFTIKRTRNFEYSWKDMPPLLSCDDNAQFLYFVLTKLEYSLLVDSDTPLTKFYEIVNREHSCFNQMFQQEYDETSVYIEITSNYNRVKNSIFHGCFLIASFISFIFYIWCAYLEIEMLKFGKLLLKFIPNVAAQSNPIFSRLLRGERITTDDVNEFIDNIKTSEEDLSFFCILFYDFSENITNTLGNVEKYLLIKPKNIHELVEFILEKCPSYNKNDIVTFFENKTENESMNFSFKPGHEISLIFSKFPDAIVVKDDSHHYDANARIRMTKRLNQALDCKIPTDIKSLQQVVLIMINPNVKNEIINIDDFNENNKMVPQKKQKKSKNSNKNTESKTNNLNNQEENDNKEIFKVLKNIIISDNDFMIIDTRNYIISFSINATDPTLACKKSLEFVESIHDFLPKINVAISIGGPLYFFDSMKNQTTKSRCVGPCYDTVKMMLASSETGKPLITKQIYETAGEEIEKIHFEQLKIASDISVDVRV